MKKKKRILPVGIAGGVIVLCTVAVLVVGAVFNARGYGIKNGNLSFAGSANTNPPEYSFSLTWGTYGISSYDSKTGTLIKTKDATDPKEYVTTLNLSEQQYAEIWKLIKGLDIESYPDEYDPQGGKLYSDPSMTLILTLRNGDRVKTVHAGEIALTYDSDNRKGQKFLDVCKGVQDILTETNEWKALPEYEFFYD